MRGRALPSDGNQAGFFGIREVFKGEAEKGKGITTGKGLLKI